MTRVEAALARVRSRGRHPRSGERGNPHRERTRLATILIVCLLTVAGCRGRTNADYVPPPDSARRALVLVLDSWNRGEPPGPIGAAPTVEVGDAHRKLGQKLVSYEVLGELPSSDGRRFAVRLKLDNPAAEETVNYLVIGIDPLWVFRDEDFTMATHWEHNMPPDAATKAKPRDLPTP